ncbi:uncharacterized protein MYCFIDRAFT_211078 [Pseudocercospora fijiensis CIRAD86]|uniref:Uncharacterized protein n=1 Tax=Pseudocercospora fijiensis (strain CIRAD86) TaxID=383855 RepID=M3AZA7_PSEFD|nr:uncharacterized protein MYCFIDRAFT_211078 [Pseudocercospora fijiensis CIRAD86]EME82542.1 hypothetical protein MYCFIDRAFT_211078 [Pseudocercospora fijiensis CIRAD86]
MVFFYSLLALASISAITNAYSIPSPSNWPREGEYKSTATLPLNEIANIGEKPIPTPTASPKYILLGLGYQNYTCDASKTWVQTTPSAGAVADLYDITHLLTTQTKNTLSTSSLKSFERCLEATRCTPNPSNNYCTQCRELCAAEFNRKSAGHHFFDQVNGTQTPNFDISNFGDFLSGKKLGSADAPENAYEGSNGLGAVDWLYLGDNGSGRTHGVGSVYRVETAGGVAPEVCGGEGFQLQVPYAAEYWFYE